MMRPHFKTLDGMRGVAAAIVALFHMRSDLPFPMPSAHLAVDFFFLLSGFVIALAYDRRLDLDLNVPAFMRLRLIRLYPVFAAGAALAALKAWAQFVSHDPQTPALDTLVLGSVLGFFFLPTPIVGAYMFLNIPAWSLMFEMIANLAYAVGKKWFSTSRLAAFVGVMGVALATLVVLRGELAGGDIWPEMAEGLIRVGFSFFCGVLVYRLKDRFGGIPRIPGWICAAVLAGLLIAPTENPLFQIGFVLIVSPILLIVSSRATPMWAAEWLGTMSYPMYALHVPLMSAAFFVGSRFGASPVWSGLLTVAILAAASGPVLNLYDKPARVFLQNILAREPATHT